MDRHKSEIQIDVDLEILWFVFDKYGGPKGGPQKPATGGVSKVNPSCLSCLLRFIDACMATHCGRCGRRTSGRISKGDSFTSQTPFTTCCLEFARLRRS